MLLAFSNRLFDQVHGFMVTVGGDFVSNQAPDAFLGVEFRMIGWKVFHLHIRVFDDENRDSHLFPSGRSLKIDGCPDR